jgi:hypothetical protein
MKEFLTWFSLWLCDSVVIHSSLKLENQAGWAVKQNPNKPHTKS